MKRIILFFLMIATDSCKAEPDLFRHLYDTRLINYIGVSDFKEKGTNNLTLSYTITKPGHYLLTETILSETLNDAIIIINSNDVVLDLHGNTITQRSVTNNTNGIMINNSMTNVCIKNGIIRKTTKNGLEIGQGCSNIMVENITIIGSQKNGIFLNGTISSPITNFILRDSSINGISNTTTHAIGLTINYCNRFKIIDSEFTASKALTNSCNAYGVFIQNSKNGTCIQCSACVHEGETMGVGFYATSCNSLYFQNCSANNNNAIDTLVSESYGFFMDNTTATTFNNCDAAQNSSVNTAAGFRIKGSKYNRLFECTANNNFITGSGANDKAHGFMVDTTGSIGHHFEHCTASGNQGSTNILSVCAGFSLATATHCIIANSLSQANGGTAGFGIGINLAADCSLCLIRECKAVSNRSLTAGQAIGIRDQHLTGTSSLIDNFAFGNRDSSLVPSDKNYSVLYNDSKVVQDINYAAISTITVPTRRNVGVKIAP